MLSLGSPLGRANKMFLIHPSTHSFAFGFRSPGNGSFYRSLSWASFSFFFALVFGVRLRSTGSSGVSVGLGGNEGICTIASPKRFVLFIAWVFKYSSLSVAVGTLAHSLFNAGCTCFLPRVRCMYDGVSFWTRIESTDWVWSRSATGMDTGYCWYSVDAIEARAGGKLGAEAGAGRRQVETVGDKFESCARQICSLSLSFCDA